MNFIDTAAAGRHCGVSRSFLAKRRVTGEPPIFHKLGKRVVYDVRELDQWIAQCKRRSTGPEFAAH
jgi:hypothetical protein